ncbi:MAG: bifunctional proline dehydrogenase/L-glutamate gamma-semialdehyde dehydrogenase PutA [Cardiobacteriaceae bacterium]|nr:bifunctional proline dehydrogenase/L-glutamate gamma-semialdehyde dehydrogenase PutA [Cardiobacteriaceae bacterium]
MTTFQFAHPNPQSQESALPALRQAIIEAYRADEVTLVQNLLHSGQLNEQEHEAAEQQAQQWVSEVRSKRRQASGVDALMREFSLSSEEGVALMCLAEALLRIPDNHTRDALIADKLAHGDWKSHIGNSPSLFVNATAWGLLLTGKLTTQNSEKNLSQALSSLLRKGGEPLIRQGVDFAMKMMGKQFVMGENIESALQNGKKREAMGYRYSFDMLGEAALTQHDADRYYQDYERAIHAIGKDASGAGIIDGNGISVKLSAIHPRYSRAQYERVMQELLPRLKALFLLAKHYNIGLNIDAEEANRLDISLDLLTALLSDPDLAGFDGIGFVVQAYQKRCPFVIDYVIRLAREKGRKLMIRLVKGAYWDSEIKWAQVDGMQGYPVYTRKVHTDLAYLACARKLLAAQDVIFPQFATHNAYTLAAVLNMGKGKRFECQCLYGMGETLYDQVLANVNGQSALEGRRVRVYAPVGTHQTLLAYLVRRLLENGANSSFVNQIVDERINLSALLRNPAEQIAESGIHTHPSLPLPRHLYGTNRLNSYGIDFSDESALQALEAALNQAPTLNAHSLIANHQPQANPQPITNPADSRDVVGMVTWSTVAEVNLALERAEHAKALSLSERTHALKRFADLLEQHHATLMALAVREAGKTLNNAVAEVREAVDFCRYYAEEALRLGDAGLAAESKVMVAISPWNFPLAIFVGEVVAALAAGHRVLAKPAEQTPLIAFYAVQLMHEAGFPEDSVQLLLGAGEIGSALTQDKRIGGVIFTGSTEVAKLINQTLAKREDNPILIAETGGMNAMIVDSTALPEQVVNDVLVSAFDSAGQRCSALRILCVQEEIADGIWEMLTGAMNELRVGNVADKTWGKALSVDVSAVIDKEAQSRLQAHIDAIKPKALRVHQISLPEECQHGTFIAPIALELSSLEDLRQEVFGPVLHMVRYAAKDLDRVIDAINAKGYALTHGIHSRIDARIAHIKSRIQAGNIYVNRNIVGAVVGVQPFGGHGLSGTGPKAGGEFYLQRLSGLSTWQMPNLSRIGQADLEALTLIEQDLHHLPISYEEKSALFSILGQARVRTLRHAEKVLVGPTGERNAISWHMPQWVYLYGGTLQSALHASIALIANGAKVVIDNDSILAQHAHHLTHSKALFATRSGQDFRHVVALSALPTALKQQLAQQNGALVKFIDARDGFDVLPLFDEIATSINTTAAGGNAHLMAKSDA